MNFSKIKKSLFILLPVLFLASGRISAGQLEVETFRLSPGAPPAEAVKGQVIVKFKPHISKSRISALAADAQAEVKASVSRLGVTKIASGDRSAKELVDFYSSRDDVVYASPNYIYYPLGNIEDVYGGSLEDLKENQWGLYNTRAYKSWDISAGTDVVIAIVDTGLDYEHEKLASNMWNNPNAGDPWLPAPAQDWSYEKNGTTFTVVGDLIGWNFIYNSTQITKSGEHGTHVAGIAAASCAEVFISTPPMIGGAWDSRIMAVEVLDDDDGGTSYDVMLGIMYAADRGADVINMSLGVGWDAPHDPLMEEACNYAYEQGSFLVGASGNDAALAAYTEGIGQPASYSSVLAVGATDEHDYRAVFSNYGAGLDIAAPGVNIYSAIPGDEYEEKQGTSMAAPYVSAVAAQIISLWKGRGINWYPTQVRQVLISTADKLGRGWTKLTGYGRLNAYEAVKYARHGAAELESSVIAYPNPFKPHEHERVVIALPEDEDDSIKRLRIYAVDGTPIIDMGSSGTYTWWDGTNEAGKDVASGLYFYYIETDNGSGKGRIAVVR